MVFRCLKHISEDYILSDATPDEVNAYIVEHCEEHYEIPPDVVIFRETRILLECPMLVGFRRQKRKILVPFTKRCAGTSLVEVNARKKDFEFFRNRAWMNIDESDS
jgi:Uncharacterized protein conserved in archaea